MNSSSTQLKKQKIDLIPPNFREDNFIGYKAGLRPNRKGGVRLDAQLIRGKVIIHNYGHGAAGVSIGPGYAHLQVQKFFSRYGSFKNIGIIGSGYIGLFTALELSKLGYKTTIYAKQFVKENGICSVETDVDHPLTSQIAGGYWMPYGYEYDVNEETKKFIKMLACFLSNIIKILLKAKSISTKNDKWCQIYESLSHRQSLSCKKLCPQEVINDYKEVQVGWGNGNYYDATMFTSILIEGDIFLKELVNQCKKNGINFIQADLKNENDVYSLPHDFIFNCAGIHSGKLFNDKNVYPIKGQLAVFKHTKGVDYYLSATGSNNSRITIYPHSSGTSCGITSEKDVWDQRPTLEICQNVAKNAQEFFKDKVKNPKL